MTQHTNNSFGSWRNREISIESVGTRFDAGLLPYSSPRFFAMRRFVLLGIVGVFFAMTLSHFLTREIVQRDAELTSQFVANIVSGHGQQVELVKILDERTDLIQLGIGAATAEAVRHQFYDHLKFLPEMQHTNVYAADRKIIWSSNHDLIGKVDESNDELAQVIRTREMVTTDYLSQANHNELEHKLAQAITANPQQFFVEDYIPLFDENGSVLAVVDIYKEPQSLLDTIHHGYLLVWLSTALTILCLYLAKFLINRRAELTIEEKRQRLLQEKAQRSHGAMTVVTSYDFRKPHKLIRTNTQLGRMRRTG
jgi:two-component system sensor histidine kinase HydH